MDPMNRRAVKHRRPFPRIHHADKVYRREKELPKEKHLRRLVIAVVMDALALAEIYEPKLVLHSHDLEAVSRSLRALTSP